MRMWNNTETKDLGSQRDEEAAPAPHVPQSSSCFRFSSPLLQAGIVAGSVLDIGCSAGILWAGQGAIMTSYPSPGHAPPKRLDFKPSGEDFSRQFVSYSAMDCWMPCFRVQFTGLSEHWQTILRPLAGNLFINVQLVGSVVAWQLDTHKDDDKPIQKTLESSALASAPPRAKNDGYNEIGKSISI
ncbi:conserved hypothetical protein [Ricinus communis]|uniref:Uncharacterized protein n=1 Tax=Ricinus communis TaxID=3988 RepID=B9RMZ4_RICCO|nr:conserved hypothetical protein [Ricinus communis]